MVLITGLFEIELLTQFGQFSKKFRPGLELHLSSVLSSVLSSNLSVNFKNPGKIEKFSKPAGKLEVSLDRQAPLSSCFARQN